MGKCLVALTWLVQVILGLVLPVASMVVASMYNDKCQAEPMINVYLYVAGAIGFVSFAYALVFLCCVSRDKCSEGNTCAFLVIEILIALFMFAWFIAGSVWVYRNYKDYKAGRLDCDDTLYLFAFVLLTIQWVLFALKSILSCCSRRAEGGAQIA